MKKNLFVLVCLVALTNPCYAGFGSFLKDCADIAVPGFGFNEAQNVQDAGKMVLQNASQTFTYNNEYIRIDDLADELTTKMEHIDYLYSNYLTDTDPEADRHEELATEIKSYLSYLNGVQNLINNQIYIPVYSKYANLLIEYKYNNNYRQCFKYNLFFFRPANFTPFGFYTFEICLYSFNCFVHFFFLCFKV